MFLPNQPCIAGVTKMKTLSTRQSLRQTSHRPGHSWKGILALLAGLVLVACDNVPTETSINGGTTNRLLAYSGPSCSTTDACTFKVEFWNKMSDAQCTNCHDSQANTTQSPFFMESSDVNVAYTQALTVVNLGTTANPGLPADSTIVSKISAGHNCGDPGACAALATIVTGYITNWANGGSATSGGESNNTIVLTPPTIRDTGSSRSFPASGLEAVSYTHLTLPTITE